MAKINVSINKKIFTLSCTDGDETRISNVAKLFESKLNDLRLANPNTSSDLLMTICILETQDQLSEALKKISTYDTSIKEDQHSLIKNIKDPF